MKEKKVTLSNERYKKLNIPTTPFLDNNNRHEGQHDIISIIQRIKNKAKEMDTNTMIEKSPNNNGFIIPSKSNFTRSNFYVNDACGMTGTPNNT